MMRSLARGLVAAALALAVPQVMHAQEPAGVIAGRVTDKATGAPIARARVQAVPTEGRAPFAITDSAGAYRLPLAAGRYQVIVTRIGHRAERLGTVDVGAGATRTLDVALADLPTTLDQVVTTATRGAEPEKILDSPNSISVVQAGRIAERPSVTVTDHLKAQPGLSISTGGIGQANIVSRGFNNAFSTQMLMLQDYRFAGVPSLRVNVPMLFTGTNEDIERIEVLQGPAAALYGPNSGNGVLHVITKSPFTSQGTTLTIDGGERSLGRGSLRHAGTVGSRFGYKLSGEYTSAHDFEYRDPNEPASYSSTDMRIPAERRGKAVSRNFDMEKMAGEARVDIRPGDNTELITTAGYSRVGSAIEITTTFGAAQVRDWSYLNLQQRFRHKQFFAQAFYNTSDAGNADASDPRGTYYLRSGIPVVDRSHVLVGQLQQGLTLGRVKLVAGGEYIATRPVTAGTINGRNEGDDAIDEFGAYLQGTVPLGDRLEFMTALRGDGNSRIEGAQFSPRAALIFKPSATQNLRLTFNRAFSSSPSYAFFLDQYSGLTPVPGMPVQIMGNPPKTGWSFARSCTGGAAGDLCMRSPWVPTTGPMVPANAAAAYPGFMQALPQIVRGLPVSSFGAGGEAARQQLLGLLTQLGPFLNTLRPTDAQVGTILRDLASPTRNPVSGVSDLAPLGAQFSNTWEVGYKGILGDRLRIATDVWYQRRPADPTTQIVNPGVTFDGAKLKPYLQANIQGALQAQGMPAAQAQATAAAAADGLTAVMAAIPVGAVAMNSANYDKPYLVFTYRNADGYINVGGVDFATDLLLGRGWTVAGTYSFLSQNVWTDAPGASSSNPLAANTPKHRGTLTLRFEDEPKGYTAEVRGRYADAFPVNSGVYNSYGVGTVVPYAPVPVNALLDAGISWRLPIDPRVRWSLNATNLLDNQVPTFVGVPAIGRLIMTRVSYEF